MAITLSQAALLTPNDLQGGVLETFVQTSPVLDDLPFQRIDGSAKSYNKEATLPGIEFRAINAAYSESTGTVNQASESVVIMGGDADVDDFIQATQSGLNDQLGVQTGFKTKAASFKFSDAFFNGDIAVDTNSFDGIKKRTVGAQVLTPAVNGIPILGNGTTDPDVFMDALDAALTAAQILGANGAIYCNDLVFAKFGGVARRKGLVTDGEMVFGSQTKRVAFYRGTPIKDPGLNLAGTRILPQTETVGSSTDCSSIYAVRWGQSEADQAVTGLYNGNPINGVQEDPALNIFRVRKLGELNSKPSQRIRIEGYVGLAVYGGRAVSRVTGVRAA